MTDDARLVLPAAPPDQQAVLDAGGVACWEQDVLIRTYEPAAPDPFPQHLRRRVYQGSSGAVHPLPLVDRIAAEPRTRAWRAVHLENRWLRVVLLPEVGGRVHVVLDKVTGTDLVYRNDVVKPALVGLAGPWLSGGIELNWPQHHRPGTFLPVSTHVVRSDDGAVTVWQGDVDPLQRMRGDHGVRLRPDVARLELDVRLHNRTDEPQTFLWWANAAVAVHDDVEVFFPTDVTHVADHARRAVVAYPHADRPYYGVDYPALAARTPGADRLDRPTRIPVPTSYMVTGTADAFFGAYDHRTGVGLVHHADRQIAPGKKLWTWGSGATGRAWDRHLTDTNGPYAELMAGVFTDNQPDFSHLAPGETRRFTQCWWPVHGTGPVHQATDEAAVAVDVADGRLRIAVAGVRAAAWRVRAWAADPDGAAEPGVPVPVGVALGDWAAPVAPGAPCVVTADAPGATSRDDVVVRVEDTTGRTVVVWHAHPGDGAEPATATVPPHAADLTSVDELLLTAAHLQQYRHPTRDPEPYLRRVLAIDPDDSNAHLALAARERARGRYAESLAHLDRAAGRLLHRNLHPRSGELSLQRGLTLARLGRDADAVEAFTKAAWDGTVTLPAHLGAARALLRLGDVPGGLRHARAAHAADPAHPGARAALVVALRGTGDEDAAARVLADGRAEDPLDPLLAALAGALSTPDPRTLLLVAHDLAALGDVVGALAWADRAAAAGPTPFGNAAPVAHLLHARLADRAGDPVAAADARAVAARADRTLAFPSGLDDHDVLVATVDAARAAGTPDPVALGLLGDWLLAAGRAADALAVLEEAVAAGARDAVVHRDAAIAVVEAAVAADGLRADESSADGSSTDGSSPAGLGADGPGADGTASDALARAAEHLAAAVAVAGPLPRLVHEADQVARLRGAGPAERLAALEASGADLGARDDLAVTTVHLLLDVGRVDEALHLLRTRAFQPFEGGEGQVLAAWDRACVAAAAALPPAEAAAFLDATWDPPATLGEGRHPAAPVATRLLAAGDAHVAAGDVRAALDRWARARDGGGLLAVAPRPAREDDLAVGTAHERLGEAEQARAVWEALEATADDLEARGAQVDYFATSLPELLLLPADDARGRAQRVARLRAAAARGRGTSVREVDDRPSARAAATSGGAR
ncbi:DUF5107 domain-containing protein [Cellulomonas sp. SLBN-39]|uniref:DUF5107 domain-containing protein n=1 Tax=Cellulomonas sp. SLBN-39 TaxID=2768446 RepID=UPI00114E790E|nr:DUF5107 domain-containing protein [Cellulomonas sp. SLBN-39]TQL01544.1 Flp pilus assembly protein TadD [Cellulomonas sp. SLBN-39]